MRRGIFIALPSVAALLTASATAATAAGPVYHPVYTPTGPPIYTPAERPSNPPAGAPAGARPPNGFRIQRVRRLPARGAAIAFVRVFASGRVIVWGPGIRKAARGTGQRRVVRVPVRPKARLRRHLRRRGKARIRIKVAFRPFGGVARPPRQRPVVLRQKRR